MKLSLFIESDSHEDASQLEFEEDLEEIILRLGGL